MNVIRVDSEDFEQIVRKSKVLHRSTEPDGSVLYVAEYGGDDVLIIREPVTGTALFIDCLDAKCGNLIHDHARSAIALGTL